MPQISVMLCGEPIRTYEFSLHRESKIRIGRAADNDIVIELPSISEHHAEIERSGSCYRLRDLKSSNGTFFCGSKIEELILSEVVMVDLGKAKLKFILSDNELVKLKEIDRGLVSRSTSKPNYKEDADPPRLSEESILKLLAAADSDLATSLVSLITKSGKLRAISRTHARILEVFDRYFSNTPELRQRVDDLIEERKHNIEKMHPSVLKRFKRLPQLQQWILFFGFFFIVIVTVIHNPFSGYTSSWREDLVVTNRPLGAKERAIDDFGYANLGLIRTYITCVAAITTLTGAACFVASRKPQ